MREATLTFIWRPKFSPTLSLFYGKTDRNTKSLTVKKSLWLFLQIIRWIVWICCKLDWNRLCASTSGTNVRKKNIKSNKIFSNQSAIVTWLSNKSISESIRVSLFLYKKPEFTQQSDQSGVKRWLSSNRRDLNGMTEQQQQQQFLRDPERSLRSSSNSNQNERTWLPNYIMQWQLIPVH